MDGRDQRRQLIGRDLIASNIGGDDLRGEFGRLLIGHRQVLPHFRATIYTTPETEEVIEDSPYDFVAPLTSFGSRPSHEDPPLSHTKVGQEVLEPLGSKKYFDIIAAVEIRRMNQLRNWLEAGRAIPIRYVGSSLRAARLRDITIRPARTCTPEDVNIALDVGRYDFVVR